MNDQKITIIEAKALGQYLCGINETKLSYNEIITSLENGDYPECDQIAIWEAVENIPLEKIAEMIKDDLSRISEPVIIHLKGGLAEVISGPTVNIIIRDFDIEGISEEDESDLTTLENGDECFEQEVIALPSSN